MPPTHTGGGRSGAGASTASRSVTVGPSYVTGSPPKSRCSTSSDSSSASNRSPISPKRYPNASNSSRIQPAPSPRSSRPPESRSIDAAVLARSAGWRNGAHSTSVPIRTRSVTAAIPASVVSGSSDAIGDGSAPYLANE